MDDGKKSGTTLQCNKVKGCDPVLVQKIFLVIKFLIDGFLDNVFSPEKLESFIVGFEESKDTCKSCGLVFKTPTGVTEHKCSFLHQNDIVEPMEFNKQVSSDADKIVQALVDHVTGRLSGQATLPTPPRPALTCADYVQKELPGGEIKSVTGDGGCMPRCVSLIAWGTEEHWKLVARALNKKTIELFDSMKDFLIFPIKRKVGGKEEEMVFKDKDEYIKFLMSEESLVMWREGPDLNVLAHLLMARVDVLVSKENKLDGGCPMVYGEQYEDRARLVLVLNTEEKHYLAVVDTQNPHKNLNLISDLETYVNAKNESEEPKVAASKVLEEKKKNDAKDDFKKVNSRIDDVMKLLTNLQAKYDGKIFRLEEENRVLKTLLDKRVPRVEVRAAPVPPDAARPPPLPPKARPAQVPAPAGVAGRMDLDNDEFPQLQSLYDMKHQGFQRQSPVAPPVRKSFSCTLCKIQFDDEENLRKHRETKHTEKKSSEKETDSQEKDDEKKNPVTKPVYGKNVVNEAAMQRVPILNGQARQYNCLECPFQADGNGSSKSLLRHSKQTKHKTSSLEEKCYTCQKVCSNFEELMLHRRENHKDNINLCRYLSEDSCKFGDRCWYSHDQTRKDSSKQNTGFRKVKESIPPDMMQGLTVLLSDLIAKHLDKKKSPGA